MSAVQESVKSNTLKSSLESKDHLEVTVNNVERKTNIETKIREFILEIPQFVQCQEFLIIQIDKEQSDFVNISLRPPKNEEEQRTLAKHFGISTYTDAEMVFRVHFFLNRYFGIRNLYIPKCKQWISLSSGKYDDIVKLISFWMNMKSNISLSI